MGVRSLIALPVFNEAKHIARVLDEVGRFGTDILVVDDGSSDGSGDILRRRAGIRLVQHETNRGYGAALASAFQYAIDHDFDRIVTIDCDGQHEPQRIPRFLAACRSFDIVSGSRYLKRYPGDSAPPAERLWINQVITAEINRALGYCLTDSFCGFKAYRVDALKLLRLSEPGYAMPLQVWSQAAALGLRVIELPVPLIYLDEKRSFGGALDDGATRLAHYREILERSMAEAQSLFGPFRKPSMPCGNRRRRGSR